VHEAELAGDDGMIRVVDEGARRSDGPGEERR